MWFGSDQLVQWCMRRNWFVWLSSFSFIIYVVHAPLVAYAINALFPVMQQLPNFRMFTYLGLPIGLLLFCVLMAQIIKKWSPKIYTILTGGRDI